MSLLRSRISNILQASTDVNTVLAPIEVSPGLLCLHPITSLDISLLHTRTTLNHYRDDISSLPARQKTKISLERRSTTPSTSWRPRMASASIYQTLHGSCACGRNRYTIDIPDKQTKLVQLQYDNTSATRYQTASPLTLWLRVPLNWYTSATFAQFPDEERTSIKRTFISPFASDTRRQFCGYCGTQLTSWHERTHEDSEHICLTVGSLLDEDQALLGQLGFLPTGDSSDDDTHATSGSSQNLRTIARTEPLTRGAPWFEDMVEHTHLGRLRQQRGIHTSRDGNVQMEWEVVEWTEGDDADDEGLTPNKRKLGDVEAEDTEMRIA